MRPWVFRVYSESTERLRKPKLSSKPGGCSLEGYGVVLPALVPAKPSEEWLVELLCQPWRFRPQFPLGPGKGCLAWGPAFVFGLHLNPRTRCRKTRAAPGTHALPAPRDIQDPPHQIIKCGSRNYTKLHHLNYLGEFCTIYFWALRWGHLLHLLA